MSVQELLATHDCAVPGCPDEARERGGKCRYHAANPGPSPVAPGSHAHLMEDTPDPARAERQAIAVVDELLGPPDIKEEPVAAPISREIVVERIRAYHLEHGRIPTKREEPSLSRAATAAFGTWGGAVEAAGFPRPKRGAKRRSSDSASSSEAKKPEARAASPQPRPPRTRPAARREPSAPAAPNTLVDLAQTVEDTRRAAADALTAHYAAKDALLAAVAEMDAVT